MLQEHRPAPTLAPTPCRVAPFRLPFDSPTESRKLAVGMHSRHLRVAAAAAGEVLLIPSAFVTCHLFCTKWSQCCGPQADYFCGSGAEQLHTNISLLNIQGFELLSCMRRSSRSRSTLPDRRNFPSHLVHFGSILLNVSTCFEPASLAFRVRLPQKPFLEMSLGSS